MTFVVECVTDLKSTVVRVSGEVNRDATPRLRAALQEAIRGGLPVMVDLTGIETIDRAALAAIVAAYRQAGRAGIRMLLRISPATMPYLLFQLDLRNADTD